MAVKEVFEYVGSFVSDEFEIVNFKAEYTAYSSFVTTCDVHPDGWEEGILLNPFVGKINTKNDDRS